MSWWVVGIVDGWVGGLLVGVVRIGGGGGAGCGRVGELVGGEWPVWLPAFFATCSFGWFLTSVLRHGEVCL